jgi:hypothetical protein
LVHTARAKQAAEFRELERLRKIEAAARAFLVCVVVEFGPEPCGEVGKALRTALEET